MKREYFLTLIILFGATISYASDIISDQIREYRLQYGPRTAQNLANSYIQELVRATYYEPVRDKYFGLRYKPLQNLENQLISEQKELDQLRKRRTPRYGMLRPYSDSGGHRYSNYGHYAPYSNTYRAIGDRYHYTKALEASIAAKKQYFEDSFFHAQHPDSLQHLYGQ